MNANKDNPKNLVAVVNFEKFPSIIYGGPITALQMLDHDK